MYIFYLCEEISEELQNILARTNSILLKSEEIAGIASNALESEVIEEEPKLVPVLFEKRKESDILEDHRGNYRRHWEHSSR